MNIELISVGTELLLGDIINTNSQFIAKELASLGINIYKQSVIGDNEERFENLLKTSFDNVDYIITTGGLGPTSDDITKETVAKYFNDKLIFNKEEWNKIEKLCIKFAGSKKNVPLINKKQAFFTKDSIILPNERGTAPGAIFKKGKKTVIMLPGPPSEMIPMFKNYVVPYLNNKRNLILKSNYIRFFGIGESALEEKLAFVLKNQKNPTMALYAKNNEVLVRITSKSDNEKNALKLINDSIDNIKDIVGSYIYYIGDDNIASKDTMMNYVVYDMLKKKNKTISIAESCTGGLLSSILVENSGISNYFLESCVTYTNNAKHNRLGVNLRTLNEFGAVSKETAIEMANGIAKTSGSNIGISTTGIAGPNGGTDEKPVGLVYIGLYIDGKSYFKEKKFVGDRQKIRKRASLEALNFLREKLKDI